MCLCVTRYLGKFEQGMGTICLRVGRICWLRADCGSGGRGGRRRWLDSRVIFKVKLVRLADDLDEGYKGKRGPRDSKVVVQVTGRMELLSTNMARAC